MSKKNKDIKKKSLDEYYEDSIEYISQRILLSLNATENKELVEETKAYVDSALFLLSGDMSIKQTIARIIDVDNLRDEFDDKFGKRYDFSCGCKEDKTVEDKKNNECCGGCK